MSQCNRGNEVNTNFLCGQENVWKTWDLRADCNADTKDMDRISDLVCSY